MCLDVDVGDHCIYRVCKLISDLLVFNNNNAYSFLVGEVSAHRIAVGEEGEEADEQEADKGLVLPQ